MSRGIFGSRGFDAANECPKMRKELCEGRLVPVPHGDFGQELQADAELDDLILGNDPVAARTLDDGRQVVMVLKFDVADFSPDRPVPLIGHMGERQAVAMSHQVAFLLTDRHIGDKVN